MSTRKLKFLMHSIFAAGFLTAVAGVWLSRFDPNAVLVLGFVAANWFGAATVVRATAT